MKKMEEVNLYYIVHMFWCILQNASMSEYKKDYNPWIMYSHCSVTLITQNDLDFTVFKDHQYQDSLFKTCPLDNVILDKNCFVKTKLERLTGSYI